MKSNYFLPRRFRVFGLMLFITSMAMMAGCAGQFARFEPNDEVTQMFRTNNVPQDYLYYFNGTTNRPWSIVGIRPEYEQTSQFFTPLEPNSDEFAGMVRKMSRSQGSHIVASEGERIGIWYSSSRTLSATTIKMESENQVGVYFNEVEVTAW